MTYTCTDFDGVATRMDGRGAVANYTYEEMHRFTQVSYNVPAGVVASLTVTYTYDNDQAARPMTRG